MLRERNSHAIIDSRERKQTFFWILWALEMLQEVLLNEFNTCISEIIKVMKFFAYELCFKISLRPKECALLRHCMIDTVPHTDCHNDVILAVHGGHFPIIRLRQVFADSSKVITKHGETIYKTETRTYFESLRWSSCYNWRTQKMNVEGRGCGEFVIGVVFRGYQGGLYQNLYIPRDEFMGRQDYIQVYFEGGYNPYGNGQHSLIIIELLLLFAVLLVSREDVTVHESCFIRHSKVVMLFYCQSKTKLLVLPSKVHHLAMSESVQFKVVEKGNTEPTSYDMFQIFCRVNSNTKVLLVDNNTSTVDIKEMIKSKYDIDPDNYYLTLNSKILRETTDPIGLTKFTTVEVNYRLRGGMQSNSRKDKDKGDPTFNPWSALSGLVQNLINPQEEINQISTSHSQSPQNRQSDNSEFNEQKRLTRKAAIRAKKATTDVTEEDIYFAENMKKLYPFAHKLLPEDAHKLRRLGLRFTPCLDTDTLNPGKLIISPKGSGKSTLIKSLIESNVILWEDEGIMKAIRPYDETRHSKQRLTQWRETVGQTLVLATYWIVIQGGIVIWSCSNYDYYIHKNLILTELPTEIINPEEIHQHKSQSLVEFHDKIERDQELVLKLSVQFNFPIRKFSTLAMSMQRYEALTNLTTTIGMVDQRAVKRIIYQKQEAKRQMGKHQNLLEAIRVWQSNPENYIKFWHLPFPELHPSNLTLAIDCIKTYAICFDLIHNYPLVYEDATKIDNEYVYNGRKVTPDFIDIRSSPIVPIEYKCSLGVWDKIGVEKFQEEIINNYGSNCIMRFKSLSMKSLSTDPALQKRNGLILMRIAIDTIFRMMKGNQLLKVLDNEGIDQTDYLLKILYPHIRADSTESPIIGELDSEFKSYHEYVTDFIECIPDMEKFMNSKHLKSEDMAKVMPDHITKPTNVGIFAQHPWDRTRNKEKANTPIGRRATWLLSAPFMFEIQDINLGELQLLVDKYPESAWFEILEMRRIHENLQPVQEKLRPLFQEKAFYKREANSDLKVQKAKELGVPVGKIDEAIEIMIKKILADAAVNTNRVIKVSKHGKMVIQPDGALFEKGHINYKKRNKSLFDKGLAQKYDNVTTRLEFADYFEDIHNDFNTFLTDPVSLPIPDVKGAFTNPTREELSTELYNQIVPIMNECISSPGFSVLYRHQHHLQTLIATVPRISTKGEGPREITHITCPISGVNLFASPAPNELVSGALVYYGKVSSDKWLETSTLPWVGPMHVFRSRSWVYFYTDPVRENWQTAQESLSILWGMLSHAVTTALINQPIHHDLLFWSAGWKFSRQVKFAYDILYIYDKNVYQYGTFGADDLPSKFEGMEMKDVRAMTIFFRLYKNHSEFCRLGYASTSTSTLKQLHGIKHPVYDSTLTGWYGSQMICYIKQELPKVDGADPVQLMSGFAKADMKYETWYIDSPFHPSRTSPYKDLTMKEFYNKVLIKDGTDWTNFAYHPGVIYRASELMTREVMDDKHHEFRNDWKDPSINTGKASKVNVPLTHNKAAGMGEVLRGISEKHATYKGLQSLDLTEALMLDHKVVKKGIKEYKEFGTNIFKWNEEGLKDIKFKGKQLSLSELSLLQVALYPKCVVVTMNLKDQRDYGKRAFFVQLVYNRNANRLWDYASRPILLHGSNPSDLILVPGMEKYLKMQDKMESIGVQQGNMGVAKDQTKFGDTYSVEAMGLKLVAWRDVNYITEEEFAFLWYLKDALQNRIVLLPSNYVKSLERIETEMSKASETVQVKNEKFVLELRDPKFAMLLNDKRKQQILNQTFNLQDVGMNRGFMRANGGVLGVFNVDWSFFSSADTMFKEFVCKELFVTKVSRSDTHSDDGRDYTTLPVPDATVFTKLVFPQIFDKILKRKHGKLFIKGKIGSQGGKVCIFWKKGGNEILELPDTYLSKIFLTITCFVPRLFSQRPSLLKLTYGIATEMLQVVCSSSRQIYVPWVRYTAAVAAEMPGKSPASDLQSAVGRVYDMLVNAAPIDVVAANLLLINMAISERFGIHVETRSVNEPLEMNGIFWVTPDLILTSGAAANMARLLANSLSDSILSRKLSILLNTTGIWAGKKRLDKNQIDLAQELITVAENESEDLMQSAPTVLKDFFLVLNRAKKTAIGFEKMLEVNKDTFDEYVKGDLSSREKFDILEKELSIANMINTSSLVQKIVGSLSKYLRASYAATRIRNSPDAAWVDRWGYIKRIMPDPFSPATKVFLIDRLGTRDTIRTIEQTHDDVRFLARSDYTIPPLNIIGLSILTQFYSDAIKEILYRDLTFVKIARDGSYEDVPAQYTKLVIPEYLNMNPRMIIFSLMIIYDRLNQPTTPEMNRWVYQLEPSLIGSKKFEESISAVERYINQLGIRTPEELQRHQRLIISMFSPMLFHGIAKIPSGTFAIPAYDYLAEWFSWDYRLTLPNLRTLIEAPVNVPQTPLRGTVPTSMLCRPLLITLWLKQISEVSDRYHYNLYTMSRQIPIDVDQVISNHFMNFVPGTIWASDLFTLLLWESERTGLSLDISRLYNKTQSYIKIEFGRWKSVLVIGTHDHELVSHTYKVYSCVDGIIPTASLLLYVQGMASMLTYVALKRKIALRFMGQLELATENLFPVVTRFNNELRVRNDRPDVIQVVAFHMEIPLEKYLEYTTNVPMIHGETKPASITFRHEHYDYVITPWHINQYPSDITVAKVIDHRDNFLLLDSTSSTPSLELDELKLLDIITEEYVIYNLNNIKKISQMMPFRSWTNKSIVTTRDALEFITRLLVRYGVHFKAVYDFLLGKNINVVPIGMSLKIRSELSELDDVSIATIKTQVLMANMTNFSAATSIMLGTSMTEQRYLLEGISITCAIYKSLAKAETFTGGLKPPRTSSGLHLIFKFIDNEGEQVSLMDYFGLMMIGKWEKTVVDHYYTPDGRNIIWFSKNDSTIAVNLAQKINTMITGLGELREINVEIAQTNIQDLNFIYPHQYPEYLIDFFGQFYSNVAKQLLGEPTEDCEIASPLYTMPELFHTNIKLEVLLAIINTHPVLSSLLDIITLASESIQLRWLEQGQEWKYRHAFDRYLLDFVRIYVIDNNIADSEVVTYLLDYLIGI